jgi:hypothetical protein
MGKKITKNPLVAHSLIWKTNMINTKKSFKFETSVFIAKMRKGNCPVLLEKKWQRSRNIP